MAMYESSIKSLPLVSRGKVRDMYAVDDDKLLIVATDRISAFDVVLDDPIPNKGMVLTSLTEFWLEKLGGIMPNHATGILPEEVVAADEIDQVAGRAMVVKKLKPVLVEAVVRGYIIGSGWKDYQENGAICGIHLPKGLDLASELNEPIFTPAAKAEPGKHDENIGFDYMAKLVGDDIAEDIREASIDLYKAASQIAKLKGLIIADTKFEFGLDEQGTLHLMDEVLTPDSSRFWPADQYKEGTNPPSFDKQFVRDWLESQDWDKKPPAPRLPKDVIEKTSQKYKEVLDRFTGKNPYL
ncbi:phosphoribosylaminoimidazole-succinocarboxamide synthase [Taylorella asinigenitalis 14/45]|uniref:Phosphoribosylaminoimidazole-succinocarboxamide synthase n=2 Tax=Taylorella asinigenitalis TaxID=84590 RepID=G4QC97_TAYAM|nr:phosphoribosylaminoimidazolesuccinocarboxamide synthase [Taylorella asinigenitalis]AEP37066.1 Phosphoribosylaminoimidazole-succinocarboxamide synthase [Taylorella asinigenitalis MCE3]CCG19850.1 phosphoribosylaminoimidazole-succinocarboxamide synthase [Taylorella asinigenitalis 14/45]